MRAMRARGRDAGGSATAEMKEKTSMMKESFKETAGGGGRAKKKSKRKKVHTTKSKDKV